MLHKSPAHHRARSGMDFIQNAQKVMVNYDSLSPMKMDLANDPIKMSNYLNIQKYSPLKEKSRNVHLPPIGGGDFVNNGHTI